MLKQYVEFFYPGSFMSESSVKNVESRTPPADIPKGAYGYRFFSQSEVTQDGETLTEQRKEFSPTTFFGEAMTLDQVKALTPSGDYRILVSNMEINGWDRVVMTVRGNFQPLNAGDVVLAPNS